MLELVVMFSRDHDPFRQSVLGQSALTRLVVAGCVVAGLWAAIAWALAVP